MPASVFPPWTKWVLKKLPQLAILFGVPLAVLAAKLARGLGAHSAGEMAVTVGLVIGLSVLLVFLIHLIKNKKDQGIRINSQVQVLLWFVVVSVIACGGFAILSAWFDWPRRWSTTAQAAPNVKQPGPATPSLRFIINGLKEPIFWVYNAGNVPADRPAYVLRLYDLMRDDPNTPARLDLKIPRSDLPFIPAGVSDGPHKIREAAGQGSSIQSGDVIFGTAHLECANCVGSIDYWVFMTVDGTSWLQEIQDHTHVEDILNEAIKGKSFDPDRWLPKDHRMPAAQYIASVGWTWTPPDGDGNSVALRSVTPPSFAGWKTWDGTAWRDYRNGDELARDVLAVPKIEGNGALDPDIIVITRPDAVTKVNQAHAIYAESNGRIQWNNGAAAAGSGGPNEGSGKL